MLIALKTSHPLSSFVHPKSTNLASTLMFFCLLVPLKAWSGDTHFFEWLNDAKVGNGFAPTLGDSCDSMFAMLRSYFGWSLTSMIKKCQKPMTRQSQSVGILSSKPFSPTPPHQLQREQADLAKISWAPEDRQAWLEQSAGARSMWAWGSSWKRRLAVLAEWGVSIS